MNTMTQPADFADAPVWQQGEMKVLCVQITQETHDVNSFCFTSDTPMIFNFKPGQYVMMTAQIDGKPISRFYSISTSPARPYNFSITIKRVPGGLMSNWMHEHFHEGDYISIEGPQGNFNFINLPSKKALMLSGGSGITPVMSMARWLYDMASDVDIHFVHSARSPQDIIFYQELQAMDARWPNFRFSVVCEGSLAGISWSGYRGFLNAEMLHQMVPDLEERTIYVCGPEGYMQAVRNIMTTLALPEEQYHEESFGGQSTNSAETAETLKTESDLKPIITFSKTGKTTEADSSETLLDIAAKSGIWIASACRMGFCGSCKVKTSNGEVICNHTGGITDTEMDEGYILTCCSYAKGNVTMDC